MRSAILPFRPILRDFIRNLWYLRFFFLLILLTLLVSSVVLVFAEGKNIDPSGTVVGVWSKAIGITLNDVSFGLMATYAPVTFFGKAAGILNSLISFILLGMLIWVVEQSLSDHRLKKSKYLFFPTEEDF